MTAKLDTVYCSVILSKYINPFNAIELLFSTPPRKLGYFLITNTLFWCLLGTFEISLIFRLTHEIQIYIINQFISFLSVSTTIFIISLCTKKLDILTSYKRTHVFQMIMCLYLILTFHYLTVIPLIFIYSVLKGIVIGSFWHGTNFAYLSVLNDKNRDKFGVSNQIAQILIPMFLPILAGALISISSRGQVFFSSTLPAGYLWLFGIGFIFSFLTYIFAPKLSYQRDVYFNPRKALLLLTNKQVKSFRNFTCLDAMQGEFIGVATTVLNFLILRSEFNLGVYSSVIGVGGICYFFFIKKRLSKHSANRNKFILIGTVGEFCSRMIYFMFHNIFGLVTKSVFGTFIVPLKSIFGNSIVFKNLDLVSEQEKISRSEIIVFQEACYLLGRIFTYTTILFSFYILKFDFITVSRSILFIFSFTGFIGYILITKVNKETDTLEKKQLEIQIV